MLVISVSDIIIPQMQIDYTKSLMEISNATDLWCVDDICASSLVAAADIAARVNSKFITVPASHVHMIWAWLEGRDTEIVARIEAKGTPSAAAEQIHSVFKKGASGAVLNWSPELFKAIAPVRHDLFFEKKLFVKIDMATAQPSDWPIIFDGLRDMCAYAVVLSSESREPIGKFYGFLENVPADFTQQIMILSDAPQLMESALRLIAKMRPEFSNRLRFFIKRK